MPVAGTKGVADQARDLREGLLLEVSGLFYLVIGEGDELILHASLCGNDRYGLDEGRAWDSVNFEDHWVYVCVAAETWTIQWKLFLPDGAVHEHTLARLYDRRHI